MHLPYHPSIHRLVDCKYLANLTVNKIRALHIDHHVKVDRKTSYQLVDTFIEININTLKENIREICEALNLQPAAHPSTLDCQIKSLPLVDPEVKDWRD